MKKRILDQAKQILVGSLLVILTFSMTTYPKPVSAATDVEMIAEIQRLMIVVQDLIKLLELRGVSVSVSPGTSFVGSVAYGDTNSSVALLQKILATDPTIYPEAKVTGYFGDLTAGALRRFQARYGLTVTGTFTSETRALIESTLRAIPFETKSNNYLRDSAVNAQINATSGNSGSNTNTNSTTNPIKSTATSNNSNDILLVSVVPNVKTNTSVVVVYYKNGSKENFSLNVTGPTSTIATLIATKIGKTVTEVSKNLKVATPGSTSSSNSLNKIQRVLFTIYNPEEMELDVFYQDGKKESIIIGRLEVQEFVMFAYDGNYERYYDEFNDYILHPVQMGNKNIVPKISSLISQRLGGTAKDTADIAAVLEIIVKKKSNDPCYETLGYNCNDS